MKLTIDKKIALFISCLIFALGAILGFYFALTQTRATNRELDDRARFLLEHLTADLEYPALVRDRDTISRRGKEVMARKDTAFLRIEGKDGSPLFKEGQKGPGPVREFSAPIVFRKSREAEEALILDVPEIEEEEIGKVYLAMSLSELNQKISRIIMTVSGLVFAGIILASLGAFLLLKRLVGAPVEQLVRATERVSEGDLDHRIPIVRQDEFGVLANSFNRMTGSLRETQEELVHSEKLSMLGLIAGGMGNELRNPLGVMNNAVFFLKSVIPDADETVREYLDIIKSEIDNSEKIISGLLDFYRMKAPQTRPVPVKELIEQSLKRCAVPENIQIHTDAPVTLSEVNIDPAQMARVLQNLITNAVQAMPEGGELSIRARLISDFGMPPELAPDTHDAGGRQNAELKGGKPEIANRPFEMPGDSAIRGPQSAIKISVADTGAGIAPENMGKLFQPLFTTRSRGIGLGLALSRKLIEANGGRIEVESEVEKGTTFTVMLPLERMIQSEG